MVIDNGINTLAIVAIDTIEIERLYVDKIRMGIYEKTGINEADIMVSATHIPIKVILIKKTVNYHNWVLS